MQEVRLLPGEEWADAAVAWRFVLMRHGAAYWLSSGIARSLAESEMILAAPGVKATIRASQIGEVVFCAFNFAPDLFCGFLTLAERHFFETGGDEGFRDIQFLPSTHPATQQFAALTESCSTPGSLTHRAAALSLAATVFDEHMSRHAAPASLGTGASQRFEQIIARMADAEFMNHSPEQLAHLCGCSQRHFNRLFHKHFKTSPRMRQTELRLLKARQLISGTDARITQAAFESGYHNVGLFNTLFKKRFGMTPSECRRRAAKRGGQNQPL
jgi:AraC-like DNA-binding protein